MINLAHLPKAPAGTDVSDHLTPLVIFVLETARLLLWDTCQERVKAGIEHPMVLETLVLVDFKDANSLPTVSFFFCEDAIYHGFIHLYIIGHWLIKVICYTVKEIPRNDRHCESDQFRLDVSRTVANVQTGALE